MYRLGLAHSFHVCFYFSFFIFSVYFCTIYIFIIIGALDIIGVILDPWSNIALK